MFKKRTLFVLGAGASSEFKLPLGPRLAQTIAEKLEARIDQPNVVYSDPDFAAQVFSRLKDKSDPNQYLRAFQLIRHGVQLSSSIDDFLDVHAHNSRAQRVGKMALVKSILEAERDSDLYFDKSNIYNRMSVTKFEQTWIVKFIRILSRGVGVTQQTELFKNVAFIVFNYDRCLEHFLFHAVRQNTFGARSG